MLSNTHRATRLLQVDELRCSARKHDRSTDEVSEHSQGQMLNIEWLNPIGIATPLLTCVNFPIMDHISIQRNRTLSSVHSQLKCSQHTPTHRMIGLTYEVTRVTRPLSFWQSSHETDQSKHAANSRSPTLDTCHSLCVVIRERRSSPCPPNDNDDDGQTETGLWHGDI